MPYSAARRRRVRKKMRDIELNVEYSGKMASRMDGDAQLRLSNSSRSYFAKLSEAIDTLFKLQDAVWLERYFHDVCADIYFAKHELQNDECAKQLRSRLRAAATASARETELRLAEIHTANGEECFDLLAEKYVCDVKAFLQTCGRRISLLAPLDVWAFTNSSMLSEAADAYSLVVSEFHQKYFGGSALLNRVKIGFDSEFPLNQHFTKLTRIIIELACVDHSLLEDSRGDGTGTDQYLKVFLGRLEASLLSFSSQYLSSASDTGDFIERWTELHAYCLQLLAYFESQCPFWHIPHEFVFKCMPGPSDPQVAAAAAHCLVNQLPMEFAKTIVSCASIDDKIAILKQVGNLHHTQGLQLKNFVSVCDKLGIDHKLGFKTLTTTVPADQLVLLLITHRMQVDLKEPWEEFVATNVVDDIESIQRAVAKAALPRTFGGLAPAGDGEYLVDLSFALSSLGRDFDLFGGGYVRRMLHQAKTRFVEGSSAFLQWGNWPCENDESCVADLPLELKKFANPLGTGDANKEVKWLLGWTPVEVEINGAKLRCSYVQFELIKQLHASKEPMPLSALTGYDQEYIEKTMQTMVTRGLVAVDQTQPESRYALNLSVVPNDSTFSIYI